MSAPTSMPTPSAPPCGPAVPASLTELLARCLAEAGDRRAIVDPLADPAAGATEWRWTDVAAAALECRDGFLAAGLTPGARIAHVGPHTPDWIVVDLACLLGGFVHAALHADMADSERQRVVGWLEPAAVAVTGASGGIRLQRPADRHSAEGAVVAAGLRGTGWQQRATTPAAIAADVTAAAAAVDPDACCTILLSSGTTGLPRGVLHSQRSLALNARAAAEVFLDDPRDVRLAWLPMSHALARTGDLYTALVRGGCLAVVRDRSRVLDACRRAEPTLILGVPAFFERLEQAARAGRVGPLAAALGGRVRVCVSGAAALRQRTAEFFASQGVPLVEGYGLAEAGPVVAVANPRICRPGTVGPPLPGIEVRIDSPTDSAGQLFVRTPSCALGILEVQADGRARLEPPATQDGWLATGDRAECDAAGHLRITGRLGDTLVLATGQKVPPAEVERPLAEDEAVAQVCVVGHGLPWPVAVVVPEPAVIRAALRTLRIRVASRRAAVRHPRLVTWIARRLARRQAGLPRPWRVRRVLLLDRAFDAAHGETTESLKLRRQVIAEHVSAAVAAASAESPPRWVGVVPTYDSTATLDRAAPADPPPRSASMPTSERRATAGDRRAATLPAAAAHRHEQTSPPAVAASADGWLVPLVWQVADGGFAAAAAAASRPLRDRVAGVVRRAGDALAALRTEAALYEPLPPPSQPAAPLADAPPPPKGRFSLEAEETLAATGLWGLFVPEAFGGAGAGMGELARGITTLAADCPTAAGMLAVHSSIGAVSAVTAHGSPEQQARHLPALAAGRPLSIFGGTEPEVGCDLAAVAATLTRDDGRLLLSGTKMFITGATYGRLVKVLATLDGRPEVVLAQLPATDTATFQLRGYKLHPLRHAHNAALVFDRFPIVEADRLAPPAGRDGMSIVWHGLNRGRVTLAAQAAGTLRLLLGHAAGHAAARRTWGQPIAARQLVQGRLARIGAGIAACDAVTAWAAAALDAGATGELEAIVAKTVASGLVRDAAFDALGIHGGRAFLVGHPLGDSLHDHLAVSIYEGESDLLGLALFRGLAKRHPALRGSRSASEGGRARGRAGAWLAWRAARLAAIRPGDAGLLDRRLREHARRARRQLDRSAVRIDRAVRRHGRTIGDHQLEIGALAAEVRDLAAVLATAWHADMSGSDRRVEAADIWCRLTLARVTGHRLTPADHAACAAFGSALAAAPGLERC